MCRNSQSPKRNCTKQSRNERIGQLPGVQYFWWKKFRGTCSAISRCFDQWLEQPDKIPEQLTQGQAVLLPKTEGL